MQTFIDALPLAHQKSGRCQAIDKAYALSDNGQLMPSVKLSRNVYTSNHQRIKLVRDPIVGIVRKVQPNKLDQAIKKQYAGR